MASRQERGQIVKPEVLVVGIDVAKGRHVAVIRRPDGTKEAPWAFANTRAAYEALRQRLEAAKQRYGCHAVQVGMESTGGYGQPLAYYLARQQGVGVVWIPPAHTKRTKEFVDHSPNKSDPKDAGLIADLVWQGRGRRLVVHQGVYAELHELGQLRERLMVERGRWLNRYEGMVDRLFPELQYQTLSVRAKAVRRFLYQYPLASDVAAAGEAVVVEALRRGSRGRMATAVGQALYAAACESIGVEEGAEGLRGRLRHILEALEAVERRLQEVEAALVKALERVPYARYLQSVPRLGRLTIACLLAEIGDVRQYHSAEALIALAGLKLYACSSGLREGLEHITKRGRPRLRRWLYMAVLRLCQRGGVLRAFYERLEARWERAPRKASPKSLVAACRKLLRVIYALVRDERSYEAGRLGLGRP
jgi:transposase